VVDAFGIAEIHPTLPHGRTWHCRWGAGPERRLRSGDDSPADPGMLFLGVGDYTVFGAAGPRAGQVRVTGEYPRLYVRATADDTVPPDPSTPTWGDVEVTVYCYSTGPSDVAWAGIEAVAKTNHLPDDWDAQSRGYGGRMLFDGRLDFEKEVSHPDRIDVQHPLGRWDFPFRRWIGFKLVARNARAGRAVHLELHRDLSIEGDVLNPAGPPGGGAWELVGEHLDDGTWSTGFGSAAVAAPADRGVADRSLPLTWPNHSVYLRTDGLTPDIPQFYKWLSVREIASLP
jgi:hypothetical protein